jgi:hypothetical protein
MGSAGISDTHRQPKKFSPPDLHVVQRISQGSLVAMTKYFNHATGVVQTRVHIARERNTGRAEIIIHRAF